MKQPFQPNNMLTFLLFIAMCSSAFVLIEPAPYEILILCCIIFALYSNHHIYTSHHFWPALLLMIFILLNIVSMFFAKMIGASIMYFFITSYLAISWFGISGISSFYKGKIFPFIFNGYVVAAMISVIFSIASFQFGFYEDLFLQFGRIKGFFKDPNVFGPFLIPPALYILWLFIENGLNRLKGWVFLSFFFLLSLGILFSFSRAAWGNYALAIFFFFIFLRTKPFKKIKAITILGLIAIPLLVYILTETDSAALFKERASLQHYDDERFSNQEVATHYISLFPLGTGPGQSEYELDISTHSLFIRILYENGLISLIIFLCFYLFCLKHAIISMFDKKMPNQGYFAILTACLIGILFNSFFIDTIHWRHVWLLLALPFMYKGG